MSQWPGESQRAAVSGNKRTEGLQITLVRGAVLKVRIEDAGGLLPSFRNPERGSAAALVGAFSEGAFIAARLASEDSRGFEYRLAIPIGRKVKPFADLAGGRLLTPDGLVFQANAVPVTNAVKNGKNLELTFRTAALPAAPAGGQK